MTQRRTAGHQLWFYQSTSNMETESVLETWAQVGISERPSFLFSFSFCVIYVFLFPCATILQYIYDTSCKMADEVEDEIENALNLVVSTAEQSSNMRKAVKEIFETVSALRLLFVKIKISGDRKISEIKNLTKKVSKLETELQSCREKEAKVHQTPFLADITEPSGPGARLHGTTTTGLTSVPAEKGVQSVALPTGNMSRQYATVVKETKPMKYKMTV
jgi:hypothetical protein